MDSDNYYVQKLSCDMMTEKWFLFKIIKKNDHADFIDVDGQNSNKKMLLNCLVRIYKGTQLALVS